MISGVTQFSMDARVSLRSLNPYISCFICKGYLIDATAITECLHTFCKSCIVKHLDTKLGNTCPKCDVVIHRSNPLLGIRLDRKMQDIVFKLVPELQQNEANREKVFCKLRGIPYDKNQGSTEKDKHMDDNKYEGKTVSAISEDRVSIQLETNTKDMEPLTKKYICCSSRTTVNHIKKLIAKKLYHDLEKYCSVDILCNDEILGKDHTLKFIYVTRWRCKEPPLMLYYQPRVDVLNFSQNV
ncbi:polycomb group RING finger protein 3 [Trichonephila clavata]|uniref:Polycomb group RING finger protein 3 n=1 Tax=Trichonephila clavata TaxID=2740835 RepID=A0A8X6LUD8_TRICU|nr:polycomb group RING finger protein 3 [Trichonephila clavata]